MPGVSGRYLFLYHQPLPNLPPHFIIVTGFDNHLKLFEKSYLKKISTCGRGLRMSGIYNGYGTIVETHFPMFSTCPDSTTSLHLSTKSGM